jgi:hypothetical protein
LLAKVKPTTPSFSGFFEIGVGMTFLEIEAKKEAHSTRSLRRRLRFTRSWRS